MNLSDFIGEKIKNLRTSKGLTQSDLADILGITRQSISRYEKGERKADQDTLFALAEHFNISIDYFFPSFEENNIVDIYNRLVPERKSKVLSFANKQLEHQLNNVCVKSIENSYVAANPTALDYGDTFISEEIYDKYKIPKGSEFKITVKGDSMADLIPDGSDVFFSKQETVENGEIAIVEIENEGATCKKVFFDFENKNIILHSLNEKYVDRILPADQVKIIGKVLFN